MKLWELSSSKGRCKRWLQVVLILSIGQQFLCRHFHKKYLFILPRVSCNIHFCFFNIGCDNRIESKEAGPIAH
jgi:hypothetical protein